MVKNYKKINMKIILAYSIFILFILIIAPIIDYAQKSIKEIYIISGLFNMLIFTFISKYILGENYNIYNFKKELYNFKKNFKKKIKYTFLIMFFVGICIIVIYKIYENIGFKGFNLKISDSINNSLINSINVINIIDLFIGGIILIPIAEEIFFRYGIYNFIYKNGNDKLKNSCIFILYSSILFSISHFNLEKLFPTLIIGIGLSCIYLCTNNLLYTFAMHSFYNFITGFPINNIDLYICNNYLNSLSTNLHLYLNIRFTIVVFILFALFFLNELIIKYIKNKK